MAIKSGRESDPLVGFNFRLEIEGKLAGYFTECSGVGTEHEIIEHKAVDSNGREFIQKIPGRMKYQDITLKRGITDTMDIWKWRDEVEDGKLGAARTNGSIIMMDRNYEDVARWDFENGWPSKVSGPSVKADSNEYGVEEVTIVIERLKRAKG
jgi:phage tail-like protein